MKAVVCTGYGPPDVLELQQVEKPVPKDHEVLIKVYATTVHRGDVRIRSFDVPRGRRFMARLVLGFTRPKNPILGMELAGEVESVGKDVTLFKRGDDVFAFTGRGPRCLCRVRMLAREAQEVGREGRDAGDEAGQHDL